MNKILRKWLGIDVLEERINKLIDVVTDLEDIILKKDI